MINYIKTAFTLSRSCLYKGVRSPIIRVYSSKFTWYGLRTWALSTWGSQLDYLLFLSFTRILQTVGFMAGYLSQEIYLSVKYRQYINKFITDFLIRLPVDANHFFPLSTIKFYLFFLEITLSEPKFCFKVSFSMEPKSAIVTKLLTPLYCCSIFDMKIILFRYNNEILLVFTESTCYFVDFHIPDAFYLYTFA